MLLAGCAVSGGWSKTGADATAAARDYQECRDLAESAVKTDADIDQDIRATRGSDYQRSAGLRAEAQTMQEHTRGRAASIIAACMRAKSFAAPR
jgi:hypothetical protein